MDNNSERNIKLYKLTLSILDLVEKHKDKIPKGYLLVMERKISRLEEALTLLEDIFIAEEKEIEKEQRRAFVTFDYENGIRKFAVFVFTLLYPEHDELTQYDTYQRLLFQKHMAYAFFHTLNNNLVPSVIGQNYAEFYKNSYLALVDFYGRFCGHFSDNEEAIELLCKYFPEGLEEEKYKDQIAEALYVHISNAGTPGDRGYAFQGIAKIESFIGRLPSEIVMKLLGQYQVRFIANNEVCRHQVYAIITYAQTDNMDKAALKFLLLDSVILAYRLGKYLAQKLEEEVSDFSIALAGESYITDIVWVCKNPKAYWSKGVYRKRIFFVNERAIVKIVLKNIKIIEISIIKENKISRSLQLSWSVTDWLLESYFSEEVEQKFRKLILGSEHEFNKMFFSLLYLDNYRGINNQIIDFDHRFQYIPVRKELERRKEEVYQKIETFYGQAVKTLTCIVGKNGKGKTSIVDFLRESFFKMLRLIEEYGVSCEHGYIKVTDYQEYNILDEGTIFLIVFQMGKSSFYLTNISDVKCEGAEPFEAGAYNSFNEFSKVAYFSNMLKNNQEDIFYVQSDERVNDRQMQKKREIGRSFRGFRQVDYSETESFIRRQKAVVLELGKERVLEKGEETHNSVNRELCYQLTFLRNIDTEKICEYLDIEDNRLFKISSQLNGWTEDVFSLKDLKDFDKLNQLEEKYIFLPDAQLLYFSSGQYAKFAFLAKLYWFLEGYRKEIKRYQDIIGENEFRSEDVLLDKETALIFIDEGETYYHPEWQRRYVKTLLEMVDYIGKDSKVQIVITTNSPFILSDILKEDVIYLAEKNKKCFDRTLGQNIHKLLVENFFMDFTIGEYARELIESIMLCLKNQENNGTDQKIEEIIETVWRYYGKEKDIYFAMKLLIDQIGEPVYRYELEKLLEESDVMKEHRSMEQLLEEKRKIEEKIKDLEKRDMFDKN